MRQRVDVNRRVPQRAPSQPSRPPQQRRAASQPASHAAGPHCRRAPVMRSVSTSSRSSRWLPPTSSPTCGSRGVCGEGVQVLALGFDPTCSVLRCWLGSAPPSGRPARALAAPLAPHPSTFWPATAPGAVQQCSSAVQCRTHLGHQHVHGRHRLLVVVQAHVEGLRAAGARCRRQGAGGGQWVAGAGQVARLGTRRSPDWLSQATSITHDMPPCYAMRHLDVFGVVVHDDGRLEHLLCQIPLVLRLQASEQGSGEAGGRVRVGG